VVSIVGFLTAIVAFGIIRLEQWLFDIKEGYCGAGWYKAKRFCCPVLAANRTGSGNDTSANLPFPTTHLNHGSDLLPCADWVTWAERFDGRHKMPGAQEWIVEYTVYTLFAVRVLVAFVI
jgi:chloride channel 3/4/5